MIPYTIKSWRGGVSDENDKGVAGSFKFGYSLNIHDRDDVAQCGSTMASITPSGMIDMPLWFVPASDGTTYAFGATGSIWARSGDGAWNFVYNDENGAIKGATEFGISTGLDYLWWATNTSIAVKPLIGNGAIPWTDVTANYKTTLDPADWHTMVVASGELMIANNNFLAKFDYDANFDPAALNLIPGNNAKALEERDDYVIIGTQRKDTGEEGHIWSWIVTALNWVQKKRIPARGVNALIQAEVPIAQVGVNGEIFPADFTNLMPLATVPGGGQVNPGGTTVAGKLAALGFFGGTNPGIWTYGRSNRNRPFALNYQYRLAKTVLGSSISTIGAIAMVGGDLLVSWGTTDGSTSEYGVDQTSSTTLATAVYEGLEFDKGRGFEQRQVNTIHVLFFPLPVGCSISAKFKTDKEAVWRYAVLGDNTTTYSVTGSIEAIFRIGTPAHVLEVGTEETPSGILSPQVYEVSTYLSDKPNAY